MEIKITWFEPAMKSQVVSLFEKEYQTPEGYFTKLFDLFYYHPYQKDKCLLAVALDGQQVVGFQSFFYWPYQIDGKTFKTFQSGNSLIHPDWRGKGIFNNMLRFIGESPQAKTIDFFIGFPISASIKNLLKDQWINPFNLKWWMITVNPLGFFTTSISKINGVTRGIKFLPNAHKIEKKLSLQMSKDFLDWRRSYSINEKLHSFTYSSQQGEIVFHLKSNKRKKIISEVIIGHIQFSNERAVMQLGAALKDLVNKLTRAFCCHVISFAINEGNDIIIKQFQIAGFKNLNKSIYFAVKNFGALPQLENENSWQLFRSDIDTW